MAKARTPKERKRAEGKYNHPDVRRALELMFEGKCAYCESKIKHVGYPQIEHFRPKAIPRFRRLCFNWGNLLLACGMCNGPEYKADQFPSVQEGGPLVNPCREDPTDNFAFEWDAVGLVASVRPTTVRGATSERVYGLNRAALRTYRGRQVKRLAFIASMAAADPAARKLLDEARQPDSAFSAFALALWAANGLGP